MTELIQSLQLNTTINKKTIHIVFVPWVKNTNPQNKHCLNSLTIEHLGFALNEHLFRYPPPQTCDNTEQIKENWMKYQLSCIYLIVSLSIYLCCARQRNTGLDSSVLLLLNWGGWSGEENRVSRREITKEFFQPIISFLLLVACFHFCYLSSKSLPLPANTHTHTMLSTGHITKLSG